VSALGQKVLKHSKVVTTAAALRAETAAARQSGKRIGFVPTMGALHAGHLSLVEACCRECDLSVVSIFVNPTQFGPSEDFARYPRDLEADLKKLAEYSVRLVFAPSVEEMYPRGCETSVDVGTVAKNWEGACRPGHFGGVATVVLKLFNLVAPDLAYFGQKDYQQTVVIRRMVEDLNLPLELRVCPTVREPDGLALSSRNVYLSPNDRRQALALSRGLRRADELVRGGERNAGTVRQAVEETLRREPDVRVQYVAVADPRTLEEVREITQPTLVTIAAFVGRTRLIDNQIVGDPLECGGLSPLSK
jgi:pantoate--beta-alanine ligase